MMPLRHCSLARTEVSYSLAALRALAKIEAQQTQLEGPDGKMPTTMITGFIGSGRTALANWILEVNTGKRFAIVDNFFGELGVSNALGNYLAESKLPLETESVTEMPNGSLCCTVQGDLLEGLEKIVKSIRKEGKKLDGILIGAVAITHLLTTLQNCFTEELMHGDIVLAGAQRLEAPGRQNADDRVSSKIEDIERRLEIIDQSLVSEPKEVVADDHVWLLLFPKVRKRKH